MTEKIEQTEKTEKTEKADSIEEKIARQSETVKKLEADHEKNHWDDLKRELLRERDLLRHLTNTQKGDPKRRARENAESARKAALARAVAPLPGNGAD